MTKVYRSHRTAQAAAKKALGAAARAFVDFKLIAVSLPGNPEGWTWELITKVEG